MRDVWLIRDLGEKAARQKQDEEVTGEVEGELEEKGLDKELAVLVYEEVEKVDEEVVVGLVDKVFEAMPCRSVHCNHLGEGGRRQVKHLTDLPQFRSL